MLILSGYGEEQYSENVKAKAVEPIVSTDTVKVLTAEKPKAKEEIKSEPVKPKEVIVEPKKKPAWVPFALMGAFALFLNYQRGQ